MKTMGLSTMNEPTHMRYPSFSKQILIIVGGFGSGKTEVSVNLAKYLRYSGDPWVSLVDLDLVNPYFRSRETIEEMNSLGINVIAPTGGQFYADLPILLPEIRGAIESPKGRLILDVGGDGQGSKALGSLSDAIRESDFDMLMVLNSRRPQTADVNGCLATMARIEASSQLRFTGLISNSHMIDETDEAIIREGHALSREVSERRGVPLVFFSAREGLLETVDFSDLDSAVLPLTRSMLKPWERKENQAE